MRLEDQAQLGACQLAVRIVRRNVFSGNADEAVPVGRKLLVDGLVSGRKGGKGVRGIAK
jgi:hypothetical protein